MNNESDISAAITGLRDTLRVKPTTEGMSFFNCQRTKRPSGTLDEFLSINRAGEDEEQLTTEEIIKRFLS